MTLPLSESEAVVFSVLIQTLLLLNQSDVVLQLMLTSFHLHIKVLRFVSNAASAPLKGWVTKPKHLLYDTSVFFIKPHLT